MMCSAGRSVQGFTLIELAIVLVIIGLIVGGVLVGQNLVAAAGVRAQISQIEKYNTAANTFRGKYGYLPGDIKDPEASSFGFTPRSPLIRGQGDGNGVIEGGGGNGSGNVESMGETAMFWVDLSAAHLIDGTFNTAQPGCCISSSVSGSGLNAFFPSAKLGQGNYVYIYSSGYWNGSTWITGGANYFGISPISQLFSGNGTLTSSTGLSVQQAYAIDQKTDDGLPQSGRVFAQYLNSNSGVSTGLAWAAGSGNFGAYSTSGNYQIPTTAATPGSSTTCYDNGSVADAAQQYSVEISNGANVNCALSFKMQAGD